MQPRRRCGRSRPRSDSEQQQQQQQVAAEEVHGPRRPLAGSRPPSETDTVDRQVPKSAVPCGSRECPSPNHMLRSLEHVSITHDTFAGRPARVSHAAARRTHTAIPTSPDHHDTTVDSAIQKPAASSANAANHIGRPKYDSQPARSTLQPRGPIVGSSSQSPRCRHGRHIHRH